MKTQSVLNWVVTLVAIVAVSYTTLYFTKAEALYIRPVGTLSVTKFVPNADSGKEFVVLQFSGVLGKDSVANLEGWSLSNGVDFEFGLDQINLTNVGSVRICEEASPDPYCDYYWSGNNVFNDEVGELQIIAKDGVPVVHIPYESPVVGQSYNGSGSYLDDVYTNGDKISICEYQNNGIRPKDENVRKLTQQMENNIADQDIIVAPFVFERDKTLGYHPGVNWPTGKNTLEAGCI